LVFGRAGLCEPGIVIEAQSRDDDRGGRGSWLRIVIGARARLAA
jgi:hypothetical protein